jgi:superfamily II DNA or RNA helicase
MQPTTISASMDWRIRIPWEEVEKIPDAGQAALVDALYLPNMVRENAKEQHVYGWEQMDEFLAMFEENDEDFTMPRGFLPSLEEGLEAFNCVLELDDKTSFPKILRKGGKFDYREHQGEAVDEIIDATQGIYKAPAGSGKTATILGVGYALPTRKLIVVNTKDIMNQWINRIHQFLSKDIVVGRVGGGKFNIGYEWTIATAQTLHSRFDALTEDGFFEQFGFVCVDEMHHTTADSYQRAINRFSSRYRVGVSATPDKTGDFKLAEMVLGPIIHATGYEGLVEKGYLVDPEIIKVKTDFSFQFAGTRSRWQRSNYPQLIKDIIVDEGRNNKIIKAINYEAGHHCLVLTKRHEHIDILESKLLESKYGFPTARLTGKESAKERTRVIELLENESCCVFSTIADEALDVPRVDRGFLVYPQKNTGLLEQQVGRFCRSHPDKEDTLVYDFADIEVSPLASQWRKRFYEIYKKRKYTVRPPDWEVEE